MSFDAEMREALQTFALESLELLQYMEDYLLGLEDEEQPAERINAIFRAAHTIKGSAGLFGLNHIVRFTHVLESLLDALRDGKLGISSALVAVLLPCCDHISLQIRAVVDGQLDENPELTAEGRKLLAELQPFLDGKPSRLGSEPNKFVAPIRDRGLVQSMGGGSVDSGNWHLSLRFGPDTLRDGMDPLSFIRYLSTLGDIVHLTTICKNLPAAEQMDAETCYLGFEIELKSEACKEDIESVFDFVRDSGKIRILPLESEIDDFIALIRELPEDEDFLGELLVKSGAVTHHELESALNRQQEEKKHVGNGNSSEQVQPIGKILVEQKAIPEPILNAALEKQKQIKDKKASENQSIRVDAERLDKLIDLIGELVISGAGVNLRSLLSGDDTLKESSGEMMRLIEVVRDSALQLRMVPIGTTFSRFQRVVRDVSKELGKDIELLISGGDTEVDKSVVEQIGDPLLHLVRNAMDHGIETAELRRERGKKARGTLKLKAFHSSGNIVIEVSDDGGGLNRQRILEKAIERGLMESGTVLSDQEIYALIFEPGFSTAPQVSNLSGRDVGMDVVKRNVTALRGSIEVDSQIGIGTTIRIHLPLTLAIIDGFLVGVGQSTLVIPLDRVVECVALTTAADNRDYMDLRGGVLPLIRLGNIFNIADENDEQCRKNVVVVEHAGIKTGFVVDRLQGEFQTVIKPLGKLFDHIKGVAGSTILGNGKVALIVDVSTLIEFIDHQNLTFSKKHTL